MQLFRDISVVIINGCRPLFLPIGVCIYLLYIPIFIIRLRRAVPLISIVCNPFFDIAVLKKLKAQTRKPDVKEAVSEVLKGYGEK